MALNELELTPYIATELKHMGTGDPILFGDFWPPHLSKPRSDHEQKYTQLLTPFSSGFTTFLWPLT